MYRRFDPAIADAGTVPIPEFERQVEWLNRNQWWFVRLKQAVEALRGDGTGIAESCLALMVESRDASVYTHLFPVLQRERIPVTLLIDPSGISRRPEMLSWGQIGEMVMSGLADVQFRASAHPDAVEFGGPAWLAEMERMLGVHIERSVWPDGLKNPELVDLNLRSSSVAVLAASKPPTRRPALRTIWSADAHSVSAG